MSDYPPPIDRLLTIGELLNWAGNYDYIALGLLPEHVPDLIRLAEDVALMDDEELGPSSWAPIHAARALGQLRAVAAVDPLLRLLEVADDDIIDFQEEDFPEVFARIGLPAVATLNACLQDASRGTWARVAAAAGLRNIATASPEFRSECIAHFSAVLDDAAREDKLVVSLLVGYLLDLKAVEAAPVIERAFAADAVDETFAGDWACVKWELSLGPKPAGRLGDRIDFQPFGDPVRTSNTPKDRAKARRKKSRKDRKRNQKKKR
jgi:hypothetical protein